ncbi:MAG: CPBP family intramembrane glutamic endopeptidase, partial [Clostridia bacterium]
MLSVFAITGILNLILYLTGGYQSPWIGVLLTAQMFIPGLTALIFIREEGRSPKDYGLRLGGLRYYLLAYLVVVGTQALHALLAAGAGLGELLPPAEGFERIAPGLEMSTSVILLLVFVAAPVQNLLFGLGEEFGWRGYLLQKLRGAGLFAAMVIVGITWGIWHAPVILMGHN